MTATILVSSTIWTQECIDIRIGDRRSPKLHPMKAWRYRDMAVHHKSLSEGREGKTWVVTHVPCGLSFSFEFNTRAAAMAAAVDLDRLRNNWADIDQDDIASIKDRAVSILRDHGGYLKGYARKTMTPRCNINGYGG